MAGVRRGVSFGTDIGFVYRLCEGEYGNINQPESRQDNWHLLSNLRLFAGHRLCGDPGLQFPAELTTKGRVSSRAVPG